MPEEHLKWSLDADIEIDYTQNPAKIKFTNVKRIDAKYVMRCFAYSLIITLSLYLLGIWINPLNANMDYAYIFILIFFYFFLSSIIFTACFSSKIIMHLYLKLMTWKVRRFVTITNPTDTIIYRTRRNRILDIAYDGNIRSHLVKASLAKTNPKGYELTIVLNQGACGKLTIKEY